VIADVRKEYDDFRDHQPNRGNQFCGLQLLSYFNR
jgi:hypothetical protein